MRPSRPRPREASSVDVHRERDARAVEPTQKALELRRELVRGDDVRDPRHDSTPSTRNARSCLPTASSEKCSCTRARARRPSSARRSSSDRSASIAPASASAIVARDDDACVADDVGNARRVGADDRNPTSHRLERRHRETFVSRREGVDVRGGEDRPHARTILNPLVHDVDARKRSAARRRTSSGILPRPDEDEVSLAGSGRVVGQRSPGVEQDVEALPPQLHLPVPGDDRGRRRDPQLRAHHRAVVRAPDLRIDRVRRCVRACSAGTPYVRSTRSSSRRAPTTSPLLARIESGRSGRSSRLTW